MPRASIQNMTNSLRLPGASTSIGFSPAAPAVLATQTFTMATWIYASILATKRIRSDNPSGIDFRINTDGRLSLSKNSIVDMAFSTGRVPTKVWTHIAVTYDGATVKFYINGSPAGSNANVQSFTFSTIIFCNGSTFTSDKFTNIYQYNYALDPQNIIDLYKGFPPANPALVLLLNEGSGTIATDTSGNNNNGTIVNATWSTDTPSTLRTTASNRITTQGFNSALQFNGTTTLVASTALTGLLSGYSIFVRTKLTAYAGGSKTIWSNTAGTNDRQQITQISGDFITAGVYNGSHTGVVTSAISIVPNSWITLLYTYNGTTGTMYINGNLTSGATTNPVSSATIGQFLGGAAASNFMGGAVVTKLVFNRALNASEAMMLHNTNIAPSGLVDAMYLQDGAGTTAIEKVSANNGTITGGTWIGRGESDVPTRNRVPANSNLVYNSDMSYQPPFTASTNTISRWIDGTASGSTTNSNFGWALLSAAGTGATKFDINNGINCIKVSTTAVSSILQVSIVPDTTASSVYPYAIAALPNTNYRMRFFMATQLNSGSGTGAYGSLSERDGSGASITESPSTLITTTTTRTLYSIFVTTSATTRFIIPKLYVQGTGGAATLIMDAWFDTIYVQQATLPTRGIAV